MSENKMEVISKAIDLMQYTYTKTSKRDRYPAKYKVLVERIQNECMNIYCYLMDANRLQLNNAVGKAERLEFQTKVISSCDKLYCYVELSMNLNLIGETTVEFWQKKISDIKYMTIGWRKKDNNR